MFGYIKYDLIDKTRGTNTKNSEIHLKRCYTLNYMEQWVL
jgi:hypothetical protein